MHSVQGYNREHQSKGLTAEYDEMRSKIDASPLS